MLRLARPRLTRVLALALAIAAGCEDPEQTKFENRRHRELEAFNFTRPIDQVWPELVQLLDESGFTLAEKTPVEGRTLETSLQGGDDGYRMLVRVIRQDETRYRVQLQRQYHNGRGAKDIESWNVVGHPVDEMTWSLIERTEPVRAAELQDVLLARTSGRGCSR